jgi:hypothetical protein
MSGFLTYAMMHWEGTSLVIITRTRMEIQQFKEIPFRSSGAWLTIMSMKKRTNVDFPWTHRGHNSSVLINIHSSIHQTLSTSTKTPVEIHQTG